VADQIVGYYIARKDKLLRGFDATCALMYPSLEARYGEKLTNALANETRQQYKELIPEIPFIKGPRARALNTFLLISAQELSVYKALAKRGKSPAEAWEICHEALRLRLAEFAQWKRWLMQRYMFSGLVKWIVARRARKNQKVRFGGFEIEYVIGDGDEFDFGVNYVKCGNYTFVKGEIKIVVDHQRYIMYSIFQNTHLFKAVSSSKSVKNDAHRYLHMIPVKAQFEINLILIVQET
jgi:hypothetical protein